MFEYNLLFYTLVTPIIGALVVSILPSKNELSIKNTSLTFSLISLIFSCVVWVLFDPSVSKYQFIDKFEILPYSNINLYIGIDGISLFFIPLTQLLSVLCILASWKSIKQYIKEYHILFLILQTLMTAVFCTLDLIFFYVFFESVLIPMFLIIGIWGARERKIHAAIQFFLYTLFGSVLMLLAILLIYFNVGTTDLQILMTYSFDINTQLLLWFAFFFSFAVKVPMIPVHIWLPEAHVEAPTAGSVILAGILLKLGTYGLLRFSIPMFPDASAYFVPLVYTLSILAIIYTSLTTLRQIDLKKIIAYSSIAHMGFVTIGLFSQQIDSIEGSLLLMLSHGLVSGALFLCVGILYDRHHTRIIKYYAGVAQTMPVYSLIFLFFTLANISMPGTSSFVAEFLILVSTFEINSTICFLAALGTILGASYAIWLYNRIAFGNVNINYINSYQDIEYREFVVLLPLIFLVLLMGIYPDVFLEPMHLSIIHNLISF